MKSAVVASLLSFLKFVLYTTAAAVLAGWTNKFEWRAIGALAGVAAFKAALTFVTIHFKEDN